jgi:hypothetical protein
LSPYRLVDGHRAQQRRFTVDLQRGASEEAALFDGDQEVRRVFGQSRLRQAVRPKQVEDRAELAAGGDANANVGCRGPCSVVRRRSGALG